MEKKYIVRLTDVERETLRQVIRRLKGSSQKVMRAQAARVATAAASAGRRTASEGHRHAARSTA